MPDAIVWLFSAKEFTGVSFRNCCLIVVCCLLFVVVVVVIVVVAVLLLLLLLFLFLLLLCRPDMTFAVDWALKTHYIFSSFCYCCCCCCSFFSS